MDLAEALIKCDLEISGNEAIINCPTAEVANFLWQERIRVSNNFLGIKKIRWIRLKMKGRKFFPPFPTFPTQGGPKMNQTVLPDQESNFAAVLDFIRSSKNPICVTAHQSHTCLLLNDQFSPERIIWQPSQYMGLNFLHYWRDSMPDLEYLLRELNQNGKLENYRYRMRRVDGSMAYYVMDYKLVENFLGGPVRISTSLEWGVIEPAIIRSAG